MTATLQALSLVEKAEPAQVHFTLCLRNRRSKRIQELREKYRSFERELIERIYLQLRKQFQTMSTCRPVGLGNTTRISTDYYYYCLCPNYKSPLRDTGPVFHLHRQTTLALSSESLLRRQRLPTSVRASSISSSISVLVTVVWPDFWA